MFLCYTPCFCCSSIQDRKSYELFKIKFVHVSFSMQIKIGVQLTCLSLVKWKKKHEYK